LLGVGFATAADAAGLEGAAEAAVCGAAVGTAQAEERAASGIKLAKQANRNEVMSTRLP
jgi:hypothetical protein